MFGALSVLLGVFFFKQKTAYEVRISDWSSDVCSSDLLEVQRHRLVVDDLVAEPARGAPAYVEALHPVAFPTPEAEGEGTVVEPRLRLIFGDEFLDRGRAVGALIIGLRHDPDRKSTRLNSSH